MPNGGPSSLFLRILGPAIGSAAVQIDQNIPRFRPVAGADDPAVFQFIHNARGAAIAKAQAPLQKRDAGFLFAANDFNALLNDLFVFVDATLVAETVCRLG